MMVRRKTNQQNITDFSESEPKYLFKIAFLTVKVKVRDNNKKIGSFHGKNYSNNKEARKTRFEKKKKKIFFHVHMRSHEAKFFNAIFLILFILNNRKLVHESISYIFNGF